MVKKITTIPILISTIEDRIIRLEEYIKDVSIDEYKSTNWLRDACERF